ncbi:MAG: hypothetical protein ACYC9M_08575 [Desulfobulbaceae bacterium]
MTRGEGVPPEILRVATALLTVAEETAARTAGLFKPVWQETQSALSISGNGVNPPSYLKGRPS